MLPKNTSRSTQKQTISSPLQRFRERRGLSRRSLVDLIEPDFTDSDCWHDPQWCERFIARVEAGLVDGFREAHLDNLFAKLQVVEPDLRLQMKHFYESRRASSPAGFN